MRQPDQPTDNALLPSSLDSAHTLRPEDRRPMTPPIPALPRSPKAASLRDRLYDGVRRHRIRLSLFFAFLVSFATVVAIPENSSLYGWGFFAPYALPLYLFLSEYRLKHHLTWRQTAGRVATWCVAVSLLWLVLFVLAEAFVWIKPHWNVVFPVLLVVGLYAALIGLGLLVLYVAVRVVRAAWKGPITDAPVTRREVESIVEEAMERHGLKADDDFDDQL